MKIIKRNGSEEDFNIEKIINAVRKANNSSDSPFLTEEQILARYGERTLDRLGHLCKTVKFTGESLRK